MGRKHRRRHQFTQSPNGNTVPSDPLQDPIDEDGFAEGDDDMEEGISEPEGNDVPTIPGDTTVPEEQPVSDEVKPVEEVTPPPAPVQPTVVEKPAEPPAPPPQPAPQPKQEQVQPAAQVAPKESVRPQAKPPLTNRRVMSADILRPKVDPKNVFQNRRANNVVGGKHTVLGNRLLKLLTDYREKMKVPTRDRTENMNRIRLLKQIVDTACPTTPLDLQTATDVVRIMFDEFNANYGSVYKDENLFLLGNTLKGTAYDMDKMVMFIEAFVQMVEAISEKKKILFDDNRIHKVLRNRNVSLAMCRMRDGINDRLGFPTIMK